MSRVFGILLAAGQSTRFGSPKQLFQILTLPMVRQVALMTLASELDGLVAVVGHEPTRVKQALAGLPLTIANNPDFIQGQSTSIRAGLDALPEDVGAAIFIPCDMPYLTETTLNRAIATWRSGAKVVVPTYGGQRGAPVLFDHRHFDRLRGLEGDHGGRALFPELAAEIAEIAIEPAASGLDLDRIEDLESG